MLPLSRRDLAACVIATILLTPRFAFATGPEVQLRASWTKGREHWLLHIQPAQTGFAIAANSPAFDNKDLVKVVDATTGQPIEFKIRKPTAIRSLRFVEIAFPTLARPINISVVAHGFLIVDQRGRGVAYSERLAVRAPPAMAEETTPRPTLNPRGFAYSTASPSPAVTPGRIERHEYKAEPPPGSPQPARTPVATETAGKRATPPPDLGPPVEVGEAPPTPEPKPGQFPFPPPPASAFDTVPRDLLVAGKDHPLLKDVESALTRAFDHCGYGERSFHAVPNGFAMASRLEQFNADGSLIAGKGRWSLVEAAPVREFSMESFLSALFRAREGHYRVVVFVVTNQPFDQTSKPADEDAANAWLKGGLSNVPEQTAARAYTDDYACTALIYEFESLGGGKARFVDSSEMTGRDHLEKSGLLGALTNPTH